MAAMADPVSALILEIQILSVSSFDSAPLPQITF